MNSLLNCSCFGKNTILQENESLEDQYQKMVQDTKISNENKKKQCKSSKNHHSNQTLTSTNKSLSDSFQSHDVHNITNRASSKQPAKDLHHTGQTFDINYDQSILEENHAEQDQTEPKQELEDRETQVKTVDQSLVRMTKINESVAVTQAGKKDLKFKVDNILGALKVNLKGRVERIYFERVSIDQKKTDRQRIIDCYEGKLLDLLSDSRFSMSIFMPMDHGYTEFKNFKNLNELTNIKFSHEELKYEQLQKTSDVLEFFRTIVVQDQGKTVASGSIIITQEQVVLDKDASRRYMGLQTVDLEKNDIKRRKEEEYRAILHFIMIDQAYFKNNDYKPLLVKILQGLESLAWLHNCSNVQSMMGHMSREQFKDVGYWMISRGKYMFYSKNRHLGFKELPKSVQDLIKESNNDSIKTLAS